MAMSLTGQKRGWEPGAAPDGPPGIVTPTTTPNFTGSSAVNGMSQEEQALQGEAAGLRQQINVLAQQLTQLQQQHHALMTMPQMPPQQPQPQQQPPPQQRQPAASSAQPAARPAHNPAWSEQVNPENGHTYYWNNSTCESTYTRPADYNPPTTASNGTGSTAAQGSKGPPGANLFVVRKMRRGEYDTFGDEDLRREFGRYGTVLRAGMMVDSETGWSKGYGFVSFSNAADADAALAAVHGSWMDGREMKVEKTHKDGQ